MVKPSRKISRQPTAKLRSRSTRRFTSGVARPPAMPHKPEQRDAQDHHRPANPHRTEPVVFLPFVQNHLQASGPQNQQPEAQVVERAGLGIAHIHRIMHVAADHVDRQRADGDVDVERVAPAIGIGQPSAQGRPQHRRHHYAEPEQRHGRAAPGRRKGLQQNRLGQWLQRASACTLQHARNQQHRKRRRSAAEEARYGEQHDAGDEEPLAPEAQPKPVARRQDDGVGNQVAGQHPRGFGVRRGQRPGDVRQRHRCDGGIQHLHEGRQHHGDGDDPRIHQRRSRSCRRSGDRNLRCLVDLRGCRHASRPLLEHSSLGPGKHRRSARRHAAVRLCMAHHHRVRAHRDRVRRDVLEPASLYMAVSSLSV